MRFSFVSFDESERREVRMRPELKPNLQISRRKDRDFELRAQDRRLLWTFSWKLRPPLHPRSHIIIAKQLQSLSQHPWHLLVVNDTFFFFFLSTLYFFLLFRSVPWKRKINSVSISKSFAYFSHSSHHGLRAISKYVGYERYIAYIKKKNTHTKKIDVLTPLQGQTRRSGNENFVYLSVRFS